LVPTHTNTIPRKGIKAALLPCSRKILLYMWSTSQPFNGTA